MKEDRLIVWFTKDWVVLDVFNTPEEASQKTGIHKNYICRNLRGISNDTPNGTKFRYETKASDLRKKNREEKRKKEQEKVDRLWKKL